MSPMKLNCHGQISVVATIFRCVKDNKLIFGNSFFFLFFIVERLHDNSLVHSLAAIVERLHGGSPMR